MNGRMDDRGHVCGLSMFATRTGGCDDKYIDKYIDAYINV